MNPPDVRDTFSGTCPTCHQPDYSALLAKANKLAEAANNVCDTSVRGQLIPDFGKLRQSIVELDEALKEWREGK